VSEHTIEPAPRAFADAGHDTDSYREFAEGPQPTAREMAWFWDCYLPEVAVRAEVTASPLPAGVDELAGLPPALVLVDENDVLRDEGEADAPSSPRRVCTPSAFGSTA
jgi:acetyl esterase